MPILEYTFEPVSTELPPPPPGAGQLIIVKRIVQGVGGTAVPADFGITTTAGTLVFGAGVADGVNTLKYTSAPLSVLPGIWSLHEENIAGYSEGTWSVTGNSGSFTQSGLDGAVNVADGETVVATITNTRSTTLTIVKRIINDDGATGVVADFNVTTDAGALTFDAGVPDGTDTIKYTSNTLTVAPGTYTLVEDAVASYASTFGWVVTGASGAVVSDPQAGSVVLMAGDAAIATITNDDQGCFEAVLEEETFDSYASDAEVNAIWPLVEGGGFALAIPPIIPPFPESPDNSQYLAILASTPSDGGVFGNAASKRSHTYTGLTPGTTYRIRWLVNVESARHGEIGHFPTPHTMTFGGEATGGDRTLVSFWWYFNAGQDDPNLPADSTVVELPPYETEGIAYPGYIRDQRPSWAGWVEMSTLGVADGSGEITFTFGLYDARNAFAETGWESVRLVSFCPDAPELPVSSVRRFMRIHTTETYQSPNNGFGMAEVEVRETPGGPDLAPSSVAYASYEFFTFTKDKAVDADNSTFWMTGFQDTPQGNWFVFDFGSPRDITEIKIRADNAFGGILQPKDFSIEVSDNGLEWDDIGWSYTDVAPWTSGEQRTFTRP